MPLDSRKTYTKSNWILWTASLASDKATFEKFIAQEYRAFDESSSRVPMTNWYETTNACQVGFQACSVVGGYFMKILKAELLNEPSFTQNNKMTLLIISLKVIKEKQNILKKL